MAPIEGSRSVEMYYLTTVGKIFSGVTLHTLDRLKSIFYYSRGEYFFMKSFPYARSAASLLCCAQRSRRFSGE